MAESQLAAPDGRERRELPWSLCSPRVGVQPRGHKGSTLTSQSLLGAHISPSYSYKRLLAFQRNLEGNKMMGTISALWEIKEDPWQRC